MKALRLLGLAAALAFTVTAGGCDWIRSITLGEHMQIVQKYPKLTLAWDPPLSGIPNRQSEVVNYQIYYREHGTDYWRFLAEIPATPHPEYTVEHRQLGNGLFDFAVSAVTKSGQASPLHSSLDSSADPISGWYVLWAQSD